MDAAEIRGVDGQPSCWPSERVETMGYDVDHHAPVEIHDDMFFAAVRQELDRARAKFPGAKFTLAALVEEVGELANAFLCADEPAIRAEAAQVRQAIEPWESCAFKPKDRRRDLLRAAALLVAEIERLDRAAEREVNN